MDESARRDRRENVKRLLLEAGVSPARIRAERVLAKTLKLLTVVGIALSVVGIVVGGGLIWIGLALFVGAVVLVAAMGWNRLRVIDKVRWQDGTVTFRTVEPGDVGESGQRVDCEVELKPTARVVYEVAMPSPTPRSRPAAN